jgi:hypothetical protein
LSVEVIQPMAVNASQMARITPRIVHIIRPMHPVCAQRAAQAPLRSDRVASAVGGRRPQLPTRRSGAGCCLPPRSVAVRATRGIGQQ